MLNGVPPPPHFVKKAYICNLLSERHNLCPILTETRHRSNILSTGRFLQQLCLQTLSQVDLHSVSPRTGAGLKLCGNAGRQPFSRATSEYIQSQVW